MSYIDGFVIAVPAANQDKFIAHARLADAVFMDHGATRIVECWQEDVPRGTTTDFFGAVEAGEGESVVFSWIEWPGKAERQAVMDRIEEITRDDERFDPAKNPVPFDGGRMIFGGFESIVDLGTPTPGAYVQGFVVPAHGDKMEAYRKMSEEAWAMFRDYGALRQVEAWQDDVPEGKQTDFFRTVKIEPGEKVVFSFIEWPSRAVCDAAMERMHAEMTPPDDVPFDAKRMIYGGFQSIVELSRQDRGE